jgi:hypothetical protein
MPRRIDPEYQDTIDELMKPDREQDPRKGFERAEPTPGSKAYLDRRDREGAESFREADEAKAAAQRAADRAREQQRR